MFDVYDEYIEVIKPKMIHIGHDEWWGAPLDVCPRCKGKDFSELFAGDINKIHGYMAAKGIKIAMWGDICWRASVTKAPRKELHQKELSTRLLVEPGLKSSGNQFRKIYLFLIGSGSTRKKKWN
jgi:hypothetical protein